MRKLGKFIIYLLIFIIIIIACGLTYVKVALPNVGAAPVLKIEQTSKRLERGKYLTNHVTGCLVCHSSRDWGKFSGPVDSNHLGIGGEVFSQNIGFPGTVHVPNITPYNLKTWTDGEIFRAITCGVKKDGSAIFPLMPYKEHRKLDREDVYSIIAYLRTIPEQQTSYPRRQLDFPMNFIVNTIPVKNDLQKLPPFNTPEYGKYMTNAAACIGCHTNEKQGKQIGNEFAGNREFKVSGGSVFSANITPDMQTGIGYWTRDVFIARFKQYSDSVYKLASVSKNGYQTVMPWNNFSGMTVNDLGAIYDYLRTVKPTKNMVKKFVSNKE